jgi:hypothetical protein
VAQRRRESDDGAFVYVVSNKSHRLYTGVTIDLVNRVALIQAENPNWKDLSVGFDDLLKVR